MSVPIGASGPRIVVAGGGTGGHIEPAMALADALRRLRPDATVSALGTARGLEVRLIPERGYELDLIPAVPMPRRPTADLLKVPARLRAAVRAAGEALARRRAQALVGFGGYVSMPAYVAAHRAGIPIVVHEANVRAGLANRYGARRTTHVYTASPDAKLPHARLIGMPLRPAVTRLDRAARRDGARAAFGLDARRPTLLVTGGSQGAQSINAAALGAAAALRSAGVQVLHVTGPKNDPGVPADGDAAVPYVIRPYLDGMADAYAAADLVLCRSGAMTVAELAAVGLPAAFVPYPHSNGEQRLNALPMTQAGGALLVDDAQLAPSWIISTVIPVLTDPDRLASMTAAARTHGVRDADEVLARDVLQIAAGLPTDAGARP